MNSSLPLRQAVLSNVPAIKSSNVFFCELHFVHWPNSITLFCPIDFKKWIFDFLQFIFSVCEFQFILMGELHYAPPPPRHLSFHLNQTLNINVIKKKKNPCPPLPLSCSSGIGWDVADFHLLHDLFPLKGMWLTKLYKQPLYFELPPTLINTFLSTGPTGYVPRQTSTWLGVVTGGDIDLFRHRYIFVS